MILYRHISRLWIVLTFMVSAIAVHADDFNPDNPPEPMIHQKVNISAEPADYASSITKGGYIRQGRTITISVTPKSGYSFNYWTLNGAQFSTAQSFSYTVGDSTATFVAHMLQNRTVSVNASPTSGGTVTGGGTYKPGTSVRIRVTRTYSNYTFLYWTLNDVQYSTAQSFYYTVGDSAAVFTAVFKDNTVVPEPDPDEPFDPDSPPEPMQHYRLNVSTNLPSTVTPSTLTQSGNYARGTRITINTSVPTGYEFVNWTLNGHQYSTSRSFTYTMSDSTANFVANFAKKYTITLRANPTAAGSLSGGGTFLEGTSRTISISLASGYIFDYWQVDGARYSAARSFTYTLEDHDITFEAVCHRAEDPDDFNPENPPEPEATKVALSITATASDPDNGIVTGLPTYPLFAGDQITLRATALDNCYQFVRWEDNSTANPRTITLTTSASYIAIFEPAKFTITTSVEAGEGTTSAYY